MTEIFLETETSKTLMPQSFTEHTWGKPTYSTSLYSKDKTFTHGSRYLTEKQVNQIFQYGEAAYRAGIPLNRHLIIHLQPLEKISAQKFLSEIMEKTRKWLQRNGFQHCHVWTLENGEKKGIHAHIILRIPPRYLPEYKRLLKKWIPFEVTKQTFRFTHISYPDYGNLNPRNPMFGVLKYVCKGREPDKTSPSVKPFYQGEIIGRRCGFSKPPSSRHIESLRGFTALDLISLPTDSKTIPESNMGQIKAQVTGEQ